MYILGEAYVHIDNMCIIYAYGCNTILKVG